MPLDSILSDVEQTAYEELLRPMSTRTYDEPDREPKTDGSDCLALPLENGEMILYDPDNADAWVQSDSFVEIDRGDGSSASL